MKYPATINLQCCSWSLCAREAARALRRVTQLHPPHYSLQLGVTQCARYLSTNSGSSWFSGAYSYSSVPVDTLLGSYVPPQNLTLKVAQAAPKGSFLEAIQNADLTALALLMPCE